MRLTSHIDFGIPTQSRLRHRDLDDVRVPPQILLSKLPGRPGQPQVLWSTTKCLWSTIGSLWSTTRCPWSTTAPVELHPVLAAVGVVAAVVALAVELFGGELLAVARCSCSGVSTRPFHPRSYVSGILVGVVAAAVVAVAQLREWYAQHGASRSSAHCPYVIRTEFGNAGELPCWLELLRQGVDVFALDYDADLTAMYAFTIGAEGDCYLYMLPDPGIEATALGASESALPGTAPAEALHTFTLDSDASRCFFQDRTTLTPLSAPVPVRRANPSGGPVLATSSTVLPCPAVPSGSLSGLHLPSFSTNLVSTAALQDSMVTTTTPGGQRVSICTYIRTGCHLAKFTHRLGSSLYTLATEPPQVAASAQVSASVPVAPPCSRRLLSQKNLLWHHRLGHPSLPRLRGMHSRLLVPGLPRSLPPLPPSPAPLCLPCSSLLVSPDDCSAADSPHGRSVSSSASDSAMTFLSCVCTLIEVRRIGLVMEVARTSMVHAAALHFLWPFAVRYAVHQLNLWPRVSLPETSPTLRWMGKVGNASVFWVWGSRAFVRDTSVDKLFACAIPCVFLGFVPDAPQWQFYHPTSRRVLPSQDVTLDESVPFYHPPSGTVPGEVAVDLGAARGAASGGAETAGTEPGGVELGGAVLAGAESRGARPGGATPGGAAPGGAEPAGVESGGAEPISTASSRGPAGVSPQLSPRLVPLSPQQLREWFTWRTCLWRGAAGAGGSAGAGGTRGTGVSAGAGGPEGAGPTAPGGARTGGTGAAWAGGAGGAGAGGAGAGDAGAGGAGAGGAGAGGLGASGSGGAAGVGAGGAGASATGGTGAGGAAGVGAGGAGASATGGTGAGGAAGVGAGGAGPRGAGAGSRDTGRPRPYFVPFFSTFLLASPLPAPSPYTERTGGLTERHEPESRPVSPVPAVRTSRRVPRPSPPPVLGTHVMALRPSSVPLRFPLQPPPESSLPAIYDPESDRARAASPTVSRLLATVISDTSFESTTASALISELVEFAACLEDFECRAAAVPHLVAMLLAYEGDPDAPDIPTPRSYAEAIMDASCVDDSATQRSSQGYTFSLGSGSVSWRSTRSSSVLSSSCEAEIYAGAMATQELRWLTYLLTDLGEQPCSPLVLYVDNKAMIALCQEHRLEHRTKHITLRYFLARELQHHGQLRLAYVATRANTADIFTKALPPGDHQRFVTMLGLVPTLPHLLTT
ncbi:unnamed protein product [Closterium sp. NIES-53]